MTDTTETDAAEAVQNEQPDANDVWSDVDPETEGAAADDYVEKELDDGTPVVAKDVKEGAIQDYRKQIRARNDNIDDDELGERVIVAVLKEHYKVPDLSYLTHAKFKDSKMGYYDKFLNPIAPELADQAANL